MVSFRRTIIISSRRLLRPPRSLFYLPHEHVHKIAAHVVSAPGLLYDSAFISAKSPWKTIAGLASTSHEARAVALRAWFRVLILREEGDWQFASQFASINLFVRELYVNAGAVSHRTSPDALLAFPGLSAVHIDAHNDVTFEPTTIKFKYHTLLPNVPQRLKRLAIVNAHHETGRFEALARTQSEVEEIRLGRCTLFDYSLRGCTFWPAFPNDHDTYFSNTSTDEYGTSLGQDIASLKKLRVIHMGVFWTPYAALREHQAHRSLAPDPGNPTPAPSPPEPNPLLDPPPPHHLELLQHPHHRVPLHSPTLWASRCLQCEESFQSDTETAERTVCETLGEMVPGLEEISWAGYFVLHRQGASVWQREGDDWAHVPPQY